MKLERRLPLAQDVSVTMKSWNSRQSSAFVQTATNSANIGSRTGGSSAEKKYVFVRPNLTADQALKFVQEKLSELTMHERVVDIIMPGDLSLMAAGQLMVTGTGTEFDQAYSIDLVERRLNLSEGFTQQIRAKGCSTPSSSGSQIATDEAAGC